jgi:hypothetical protein
VLALAVTLKGEVTTVPFAGEVTVIAEAETELAASARAARIKVFIGKNLS